MSEDGTLDRPAKRFTSLIYNDATHHLPLPQVPRPVGPPAPAPGAEEAFLGSASFLDQAASLLQAVDVSYM